MNYIRLKKAKFANGKVLLANMDGMKDELRIFFNITDLHLGQNRACHTCVYVCKSMIYSVKVYI